MRSPPRIVFLHIPKAAGTTLNFILKREYSADAVHAFRPDHPPAEELGRFLELPAGRRAEIRVVRGHFGWTVARRVADALEDPVALVTILRHPVGRVISHHRYVRSMIAQGIDYSDRPWFLDAAEMSLAEYARRGRPVDLRNGQTRLLAGELEGWWGNDDGMTEDPPSLLERAKEHLGSGIAVFGLTERFDESLVLMRRRLGWGLPLYEAQNTAERRSRETSGPPEPEDIAAVEHVNAVDLELYRWARTTFEARLQEEGAALAWELHAFRALNAAHNLGRRLRASVRYRLKRARGGS